MSDYEKAIEIKQSVLEDDNRELAEAHYKYALALEFSTEKADQALPELQKAVNVLKKRISNLEAGEGKGKGKGKATDLDEKAVKEIKEINELIPDMELKVSLIRLFVCDSQTDDMHRSKNSPLDKRLKRKQKPC